MLIINADDWGRSVAETDATLDCFRADRITSVSAMVFMQDSERAARLAQQYDIDVGLHLNLSLSYDGTLPSETAVEALRRVKLFLTSSKYAVLLYRIGLRRYFHEVYRTQIDEFHRLYGKAPTHIDGHRHRHLCANVLLDEVIPRGVKLRRNFTFHPGEKSFVNRCYRASVDRWLSRRYRLTDGLFNLAQHLTLDRLAAVVHMSRTSNVELMTHPILPPERELLLSDEFLVRIREVPTATYARL
jgi:chitin disaccharide deacetylase